MPSKSELEQALAREREDRNEAIRQLSVVVQQRDEYRQQLWDSANSVQAATARAEGYSERLARAEERCRKASEEAAALSVRLESAELHREIAGQRAEIAEQQTEIITLKGEGARAALHRQVEGLKARNVLLQAAAPITPLPELRLESGAPIKLLHPTYSGPYQVCGYNLQAAEDGSYLAVRLRRAR